MENKITFDKPNKGDIVEVIWYDHFRYKGTKPPLMTVRTIGIFEEEDDVGIDIIQNEVLTAAAGVERVLDGQYIMLGTVISIKIIKKEGK